MLNRRKQLLLAGLALLVVFAFVYATRERDPVYKDRRLSEYLGEVHGIGLGWGSMNQIDPGIVLDYTRPGKTEASDAVLSVGTNALPMLVRLLGIRESRTKLWLRRLAEKHHVFKRLVPPGPDTVFQRNMSALLAILSTRTASGGRDSQDHPDAGGTRFCGRRDDCIDVHPAAAQGRHSQFDERISRAKARPVRSLSGEASLHGDTGAVHVWHERVWRDPPPHAKSRLDQWGSRRGFRRGPGANWLSSG